MDGRERLQESLRVFFHMRCLQLVGFGEDHRKGTIDLAEPLQKFEIDFLGFMARIDQDEDAAQVSKGSATVLVSKRKVRIF